jgi:putative transposase
MYPNHVWSYDFVLIRDAYGGKIRMLTMIDEFSRKCLSIHCSRRIGLIQVIEQLANAMVIHGIPEYIRSHNGPEFIAKDLRKWLSGIRVKTAYITPPAAIGRMAFVRALMAPSETIFWMGRSCIA